MDHSLHTQTFGARPTRWPPALDPLAAWAVAAGLFLLVLVLQLELDGAGRAYPFILFYPVVLLAAWLCGRTPALAATVASALAVWWFSLRTPGVVAAWPSLAQGAALALFGATGVFAALLVDGLARAANAARASEAQAQAELEAQHVRSAEMQHRLANNLQLVSSALTLQARNAGTGERAALLEATRRLDALGRLSRALIRLDSPRDPAQILEELARTQLEAAGRSGITLTVVATGTASLDAERLTMLGMIVSEAISNALKHGFATRSSGRIAIRLQPADDGRLELQVRDDGAGLAAPEPSPERGGSLGLRLMQSLAQRLGGTLSLADERGAVLRVVFPQAEPARA